MQTSTLDHVTPTLEQMNNAGLLPAYHDLAAWELEGQFTALFGETHPIAIPSVIPAAIGGEVYKAFRRGMFRASIVGTIAENCTEEELEILAGLS